MIIWFMLAAIVLLSIMYVLVPLMRSDGEMFESEDLSIARAQLEQVEADLVAGRITPEAAGESKRALELRVLELLERDGQAKSGIVSFARFAVPAILAFGAIGIYQAVGTPDYGKAEREIEAMAQLPLEDLVVELERRLEADPNATFEGYIYLARSLMTLNRYDEAIEAYEMAAQLSAQMPEVVDELARARAFAASQAGMPQIDEAARSAVQSMTPEQQAQMIEGMVAGLAAKLEADPDDMEGWARLIRARAVMGETAQAQADLAAAREVFADQPEQRAIIERVAQESGLDVTE